MTFPRIILGYIILMTSLFVLSCGSSVTPDPYNPEDYLTEIPSTPFDGVATKTVADELTYSAWAAESDSEAYADFIGYIFSLYYVFDPEVPRKISASYVPTENLVYYSMVFKNDSFYAYADDQIVYEEAEISFRYGGDYPNPVMFDLEFNLSDFEALNHYNSPKLFSFGLNDSELATVRNAASLEQFIVSKYDFETNYIDSTKDSAGSNDANMLGDVVFTDSGTNTAAMFRQDGDYLVVSDNNDLDFTSQFGITMWVYPHYATGTSLQLLEKGSTSGDNYQLFIVNGQLRFGYTDSATGTAKTIAANTFTLTEHEWVQIGLSVTAGGIVIYINGAEAFETATAINLLANNSDLYIGRKNRGTNAWNFAGGMDDLVIYNKALSADEMAAVYNAYFIK